jgi:hypothetical protein
MALIETIFCITALRLRANGNTLFSHIGSTAFCTLSVPCNLEIFGSSAKLILPLMKYITTTVPNDEGSPAP